MLKLHRNSRFRCSFDLKLPAFLSPQSTYLQLIDGQLDVGLRREVERLAAQLVQPILEVLDVLLEAGRDLAPFAPAQQLLPAEDRI